MKWLLAPFLWLGATVIALFVVYRIWRGKPLILRGKLGPRVLRIVAILLVALGLGADDSPAQVPRGPGEIPESGQRGGRGPVQPQVLPGAPAQNVPIEAWLSHQRDVPEELLALGSWSAFKDLYTRIKLAPNGPQNEQRQELMEAALKRLPAPFAYLVKADLDASRTGKPLPTRKASDLLAIQRAMETHGYYDAWLASYLWRFTAPLDATRDAQAVEILTALGQHVRITHALIRAHAQVKPADVGPRAWMSKAGPPRGFGRFGFDVAGLAQFAGVFNTELARADLGPWQRDGIARFKVAEKGPLPTLLRDGKKTELKHGEAFQLGRLDALQTPVGADTLIEHDTFGTIRLQQGRTLLVWDLPRMLDDGNRPLVSRTVRAAMDGKEDAARQVEQALPVCQKLLREELQRDPEAPGAARMRLILALFDDAVLTLPRKPGEK
jgi:hypothetical protein